MTFRNTGIDTVDTDAQLTYPPYAQAQAPNSIDLDGPTRKHARTTQHRWHQDALAHYHRYNMSDDAPT